MQQTCQDDLFKTPTFFSLVKSVDHFYFKDSSFRSERGSSSVVRISSSDHWTNIVKNFVCRFMRIGGGAAKGLQVAAIKLLASQTNTPKYYTTVLNKQARKETSFGFLLEKKRLFVFPEKSFLILRRIFFQSWRPTSRSKARWMQKLWYDLFFSFVLFSPELSLSWATLSRAARAVGRGEEQKPS